MNTNKSFNLALILSQLFFLRKGIQYMAIGSIIPMLLGICLLLPLLLFKRHSNVFLAYSRIWSIIIMFWSSIRILFSIMNAVTDMFDEYHSQSQFGTIGVLISLFMLFLGLVIFRNSKKLIQNSPFN